MKSSSLKSTAALAEMGVDPSKYRDALIHEWYLQGEYAQHLEVYILRESSTETFFFHTKDGELTVKGKPYSVTWINSPAVIRQSYAHVLISLRYCRFLGRGYALVKGLEGEKVFDKMEYR